jgi:hypothetical protein
MSTTFHHLAAEIADLPVISAHEHHRGDDDYRGLDLDGVLMRSYVGWMYQIPGQVADRAAFLETVRFNSYFVWLERGLQKVYGTPRITPATWDEISAAIRAAHDASPTWHVDLMRIHGLYRRAIQDSFWNVGSVNGHPELFAPTFRINAFVICHHPEMADHNGTSLARFSLPWTTFDDHLAAVRAVLVQAKAEGAVALKSALAYDRDIAFRPADRAEAARAFGVRPTEVDPAAQRAFQDFMYDYICTLAAELELPFQNHTGLGLIAGSNPMHLECMIARHPRTTFVLFHGGYPWVQEIGGLAHNYRNAYPDLTWLPLISPTAAVQAVREWLEVAPSGRTICWGGDAFSGEESVGGALALKHVLAEALGQLADTGYLTHEDALVVARRICCENAVHVYGAGVAGPIPAKAVQ